MKKPVTIRRGIPGYLLACILPLLLAACTRELPPPAPLEVSAGTVCALDGMLLSDYPGPKAQIHYEGSEPEFFCDTVEMFSIYLRPEQRRHIRGIFTQDMGKADWRKPQGQWIDAHSAFFVRGSSMHGSMGATFAAFSRREDAQAFAQKFGGSVLEFGQVTIDMIDLHGGAEHNHRM
jgi:copper chaperone NosL